jgi:hypothetical protein
MYVRYVMLGKYFERKMGSCYSTDLVEFLHLFTNKTARPSALKLGSNRHHLTIPDNSDSPAWLG